MRDVQAVKYTLDVGAVGVTAATLLDYAPKVAAVFSIVWLAIQIGDWIYKKVKK